MTKAVFVLVELLVSASLCAAADFGPAQDLKLDTVYRAETSGLVVAGISWNENDTSISGPLYGGLVGYTDAANPPATIGGAASCSARWTKITTPRLQFVTPFNTFTMPVKKGDYWAVAFSGNSHGTIVIRWIPLL